MSNPFRTLFNITLQKSKDNIPTLGKIGILGFINDEVILGIQPGSNYLKGVTPLVAMPV